MISPIGSGDHDKVNRDVGLQSRVAEVAHSVLSQRTASQQGRHTTQGQEGNGNQGGSIDIAEISSEALEAVQKNGSGNSVSPLLSALEDAFQVRDDLDGLVPGQQLEKLEEAITQTRSWEPTLDPSTVHTSGDEVGVIREEFSAESNVERPPDGLLERVQSRLGPGSSTSEGRISRSHVRIEGNRVVRESRVETESTGVNAEMRSAKVLQESTLVPQSIGAKISADGPSRNSAGKVSYHKSGERPNLTDAQVAGIQGMTSDKAADYLEQRAAKNPQEAHPGLAEEVRKLRAGQH